LNIKANAINDDMVKGIRRLIIENKGKCPISVKISDPDNGKTFVMKTTAHTVEPRSFAHEIEKLGGVTVSIG
ncbi:MAG: hypothetical protein GXO86_03765, partial [Chlorobi bacterium]|nr:hypothetical protein [Chlorobiota bacterium]